MSESITVNAEVEKSNAEFDKPRGRNRNLVKTCPVCCKSMRGDHIKRHLKRHDVSVKSKYPKVSCTICRKLMIRNHLARLTTYESSQCIAKFESICIRITRRSFQKDE